MTTTPNQIVFRVQGTDESPDLFVDVAFIDGQLAQNGSLIECETLNDLGFDQIVVGNTVDEGSMEIARFTVRNDIVGGASKVYEIGFDELNAIAIELVAQTLQIAAKQEAEEVAAS